MKRSILLWVLAVVVTVGAAVYQRLTGPTYPLTGSAIVSGTEVRYHFERSHGGPMDHVVAVTTELDASLFRLEWKRFKTDDPWLSHPMVREGDRVTANLPHQPPAGKLLYRIHIGGGADMLPARDPVVIRFKGDVPPWVLVPHVVVMFLAMLWSTRAGLEMFDTGADRGDRMKGLARWTVALLAVGGLLLGPIVQKYAFDAFWTGWPFGGDLTDNKTLVAFLFWVGALVSFRTSSRPERWVMVAALATLVVFLIPHSLLGSEFDYRSLDASGTALPGATR